jgi:hypothetical protein
MLASSDENMAIDSCINNDKHEKYKITMSFPRRRESIYFKGFSGLLLAQE